jgi:hypothetical protein
MVLKYTPKKHQRHKLPKPGRFLFTETISHVDPSTVNFLKPLVTSNVNKIEMKAQTFPHRSLTLSLTA